MSAGAGEPSRSCATELACRDCGYRAPLEDTAYRCPNCDTALDIDYDYELARLRIAERGVGARPRNIWRFEELLPIRDRRAEAKVSRFCGCTPLIRAKRLGLSDRHAIIENRAVARRRPLQGRHDRGSRNRPPRRPRRHTELSGEGR